MRRLPLLVLLLSGLAHAQFSAPGVSIGIQAAPPVHFETARQVLVQPAQVETAISAGRITATLSFTLLSAVNTEVFVRSGDARLVQRGDPDAPIQLSANAEQTINLVALAAHSGTLSVVNREGQVIARVPYVVAPPKLVQQGASLSYSPSYNRLGLSYSVSGVTQSPLDPAWSVNVNLGVDPGKGTVTSGINVSVNW